MNSRSKVINQYFGSMLCYLKLNSIIILDCNTAWRPLRAVAKVRVDAGGCQS